MNQIQDFGINELLSRRLNITDSPAPASTLAPEVMPVFSVSPPRAEDDFLRRERFASSWASCIGGVAAYGIARLYNPAGTRTLVVVDKVYFRHVDASRIFMSVQIAGTLGVGADINGTTLWDTRYGATATNQQTVAICEDFAIAAPPGLNGPILYGFVGAANTSREIKTGIVLAPGYSLDVFTSAVNLEFEVDFEFHERAVQPSELG